MSRLSLDSRIRRIGDSIERQDLDNFRVLEPAGSEGDPTRVESTRNIRSPLPPIEDDPGGPTDTLNVQVEESELVRQVKNRMNRAASLIRRGWQENDLVTIYRGIDLINLTYAQVGSGPFNQFYENAFDTIERAINNDALGNLEEGLALMRQGFNYVERNNTLPDPIYDDPARDLRDTSITTSTTDGRSRTTTREEDLTRDRDSLDSQLRIR